MTLTLFSFAGSLIMLAPFLSTDTQWKPMIMIYPVFMVVGGIWIYIDANTRVGNGCFWGALAFAVPPIGIPLYYISLLAVSISNSRVNRQQTEEREQMEIQRKKMVMQGDIERMRQEQLLDDQGGTVFDPAAGMGKQSRGFKYFEDHTAEELIKAGRFAEATAHLRDLLEIAQADDDTQRIETYRYYLLRIPAVDSRESVDVYKTPDPDNPDI